MVRTSETNIRVRIPGAGLAYLPVSARAEPLQVFQILRAIRRLLHRAQVVEPTNAHRYAVEDALEGFCLELGVEIVGAEPAVGISAQS